MHVEVRAVESHGHERIVRGITGDGEDVRFRLAAEGPSPVADERLRLTAAPERLHLFDAATGSRVAESAP